jgi:hypothetical protein
MSPVLGKSLSTKVWNLGVDIRHMSLQAVDSDLNDFLGSEIWESGRQLLHATSHTIGTTLYRRFHNE